MISKGILKGGQRKEKDWKIVKLGEPFHDVLQEFKEQVLPRKDFDASSVLQFALFMARALINILKESERKLGKKGQRAVIDALINTGYEIGTQILTNIDIPENIPDIELMSFLATIINTQAWTSIEDPKIDSENVCSFDILWCPLQRIYNAFDCRIQRYLVQGIVNAFEESNVLKNKYQIEFQSTIPSGAQSCTFSIRKRLEGEPNLWQNYSKDLEEKALKKYKS